jgi:hypothetical protein
VGQSKYQFPLWLILSGLLFVPNHPDAADLRPDDIITVLAKDAIPAILSPEFQEGSKAQWLNQDQSVVGVEINGDSRAYPVATLSRVEIVNDKVGGIPIAVTW